MLDPAAPDAVSRARRALSEQGLKGLCLFPAMHLVPLHDERTLFRDDGWPCRTRSCLITLLIFLRGLDRAGIEALTVPPADERMRELLAYLQASFDRRLTVESLARRFATNRTTLQERFVAVTGRTIMDYVTALRIEVAQGLLRDTLVPVTEVGERTGYADAASFSRNRRGG